MDRNKVRQIVTEISNLTLNEVLELKNQLTKKFGLNVLTTKPAEIVQQQIIVDDEPATYMVEMIGHGPDKIKVIKEIKLINNLGLMEAKTFVENLPQIVGNSYSKEEAEHIFNLLRDIGATVRLSKN